MTHAAPAPRLGPRKQPLGVGEHGGEFCAAADFLPRPKGSQRCWSDTRMKVRKGTSGHGSDPPPPILRNSTLSRTEGKRRLKGPRGSPRTMQWQEPAITNLHFHKSPPTPPQNCPWALEARGSGVGTVTVSVLCQCPCPHQYWALFIFPSYFFSSYFSFLNSGSKKDLEMIRNVVTRPHRPPSPIKQETDTPTSHPPNRYTRK